MMALGVARATAATLASAHGALTVSGKAVEKGLGSN